MDIQELSKIQNVNFTVTSAELLKFTEAITDKVIAAMKTDLIKEPKLYTRVEVMEKLNICSSTLWAWTKNGIIEGKRIGNKRFYTEVEVNRLMNLNPEDC
jgi:hypothetical protein